MKIQVFPDPNSDALTVKCGRLHAGVTAFWPL